MTLPGNVALAVGPDIEYVLVRPRFDDPAIVEMDDRENAEYIVAKNKVEILFNNPEILKEFKGVELSGISYEPLFQMPALVSDTSYKIYPADFVTTDDGTGIVHTAVVYGEEDYNFGVALGLPIVPMIARNGMFNDIAPEFLRGKYYKKMEPEIIAFAKEQQLLFKQEAYTHSVSFCWRCGTRLFYNAILLGLLISKR